MKQQAELMTHFCSECGRAFETLDEDRELCPKCVRELVRQEIVAEEESE